MQYNPGNPRRTTIPQPTGSRIGPPPIPEEIRPQGAHHSPASNHSGGDKEKYDYSIKYNSFDRYENKTF